MGRKGDKLEAYNRTGCGHFGGHQVLEIYPSTGKPGTVIVIEGCEDDPENWTSLDGEIHTVKVLCETCGHISLMPMTFPSAPSE